MITIEFKTISIFNVQRSILMKNIVRERDVILAVLPNPGGSYGSVYILCTPVD